MSDVQVGRVLRRYKHFLQPNGGGLTVSGGEPLLQPAFVRSVFRQAKALGLTTAVDTAGHGNKGIWDTW